MRKFEFLVVFLPLLFLGCASAPSAPSPRYNEYTREADFRWLEIDDEVTIILYVGFDRDVRIPPKISGMPVVRIGNGAFAWDVFRAIRFELSSVAIPDSVTEIGNSAFENNRLSSVVLPANLASIGQGAFSGNELICVIIPDSITSIGSSAFSNNRLTSITIPDSVESIGERAFYNNRLRSVSIGDGVTTIGNNAFSGNFDLVAVVMPEAIRSVLDTSGFGAFAGTRFAHEELREAQQERLARLYQQAGNNLGNLANTSWRYRRRGWQTRTQSVGEIETTFTFGDGTFIRHREDGTIGTTGTFRVIENMLVFLNSFGVYQEAIIERYTLRLGIRGTYRRTH